MVPSKKFRTTNAESESNSEEDDYIHKFFADVKEDAAGTEEMYTTEEESEVEETSEDDSDEEEEEDNDEEEPMPIEALIERYGKMRDVKKKQHLKAAAEKKSPTALKKNTSTTSMNSSAGWIEEDNDQDLQYESDGEGADSGQGVKQKSPSNGNVTSNGKAYATSAIKKHNTTYGNEQQDYDEDTDDFSGSDGLDDEFDTDDSEMWTDASENSEDSEESEDSGLTYLRQPYDSDSYDEDYDPSDSDLLDSDYEEDGPEDVYIPRGTAHIYDIDDDTVPFGEGMSQIIEIPNNDDEEWAKKSANTDPSSDTDIPPLVPIYDVHGEFIDSPEKLPKQLVETPATAAASKVVAPEKEAVETPEQQEAIETPEQQEAIETPEQQEAMESPEKEVMETPEQEVMETPEQEAKETVPIEAEVKTNGKQKENEDDSSSYTDEEVEREVEKDVKDCADPYVDEPEHTKFYRFYNAIDKRMALAVLKNHIYFYGHLTVQALFGQVEIMGYRLEMAETRTVTAARGYNAVSLIPLPSPELFNKAAFKNVLQKLRPHFIDIDMDALLATFDPSESVLVLLQVEPDGSTSLPVICNYLDEFNLFPTPISLRVQSSFSLTQQLLEVELLTPDVTKVRSVPLFQKNPIWDKVQLRKSSRLMVIGGKDAGKSTLCQFLINRHIREFGRIVLLDLDIGQPLVHLPETISVSVLTDPILGVGCFAKAQPPSQCLLFGSVNVVSSPVLYIKNVQQLVEHCEANAELKDVPWIVNTMGYTTGFGEELMAALIHLVQPTELIQLQIPRSVKGSNNYEHVHKDKNVQAYKFNILFDEMAEHLRKGYQLQYRFRKISVKYERPAAPLSSVKRRTLSIMTKLIGILNDETEWFTDVKPVCASLDDIQVLVMRDECMAPAKGILPNILNAMMVYLCEPMANGQQYICLGVGIVRAVDQNNMVHLLHSLPPEQLEKAKVLALCTTSLPDSIYLRLNAKMDGTIPYLQNVG
ncbi:polynucleotide 5'-hydroxyl-kinase NOL9 [Anopheles ziemanni]|uniref:polynucleotide 5'-hydroxyl-kinase NOL9 n=1 Tax=Anopheles coustani TaxID=139045 RepID=UPI0026590903|nr:polynucleotide 5'-hydroxyl-kinase NOL9 [Anopheles coustani]XP_058178181.1 polynucleotide 5'-hydroxyl-kinase NOL9 [Anopheles ziemanni]